MKQGVSWMDTASLTAFAGNGELQPSFQESWFLPFVQPDLQLHLPLHYPAASNTRERFESWAVGASLSVRTIVRMEDSILSSAGGISMGAVCCSLHPVLVFLQMVPRVAPGHQCHHGLC